MDEVQEVLNAAGIKDFDDLTEVERESYFKLLEIAESSKVSLEDVAIHIPRMRESVEFALAVEELSKEKDLFLKARLKCYILLENLVLNRAEKAKQVLEQYKKTAARTKI